MSAKKDLGPTYTQDNVPEEIKNRFRRPDGTFATTQQVPQQGYPVVSQPYPYQPSGFPVSSPYRYPGTYFHPQGVQVPTVARGVVPQSPGSVVYYPSSPSQIRTTPTKPVREPAPVSPNRPQQQPPQQQEEEPERPNEEPQQQSQPQTQQAPQPEQNSTVRPPFVPTYFNGLPPTTSQLISPGASGVFSGYPYPSYPTYAPQYAPTTFTRPPVTTSFAPNPYGVSPQYNFRPSFPSAYPFSGFNPSVRPYSGTPFVGGLPQQGNVNRNFPTPSNAPQNSNNAGQQE